MDLLLLLVAIGVTATQVKRRKCGSQYHVSGCRTATGDVRPRRSSIRSRSTSHNVSDESRSLSALSDSCSSNASGHNTAERLVYFCRLCLDFGVLERVRLDPRAPINSLPPNSSTPRWQTSCANLTRLYASFLRSLGYQSSRILAKALDLPGRVLGLTSSGLVIVKNSKRHSATNRQVRPLKINGKERYEVVRWPVSVVLALTLSYTGRHGSAGARGERGLGPLVTPWRSGFREGNKPVTFKQLQFSCNSTE